MSLALTAIRSRGDPFIHRRILGAVSKVTGIAGRILPGPLGTAAQALSGVTRRLSGTARQQSRQANLPSFQTVAPPRFTGLSVGGPGGLRIGTGVSGEVEQFRGVRGQVSFPGQEGACPKGMRLNKSDYFLKSGEYVPARSRCVSIRRTQVTNTRALRRSMRRVQGFAAVAKRTISFTKRVKMKKRRRSY